MRKPNSNFPFRSKQSSMDSTQQLIDSLTAYISLYHSHCQSQSPTNATPNPRSSILKWFSSLTVHQRQAHLTIVDPGFTQILLQMQSKLLSNGHGFFIILPDIPSPDHSSLPSVCHRKSRGLLARVSQSNESERAIRVLTRLFSSNEGERDKDGLDSMTVCEEFVEDVDRFVEIMDGISNGAFLRGDSSEIGLEWVEMEWLKSKGYYSMEAFVANRLELSLRLAWLNCTSGKKRGVKLKEKMSLAGMAANVFWRKKGCIDWWEKLDGATRSKVFHLVLGKAAKSLTADFWKWKNTALEYEMWHLSSKAEQALRYNSTLSCQTTLRGTNAEFGLTMTTVSDSRKFSSLDCMYKSLFVLQDISSMLFVCQQGDYSKEKLFFSSLGSINTISDFILRKLRGLLMVVSLDCTKIELLEEGSMKYPLNKSKEKVGSSGRKKKGKTRNMRKTKHDSSSFKDDLALQIPPRIPKFSGDDLLLQSPSKVDEHGLGCSLNGEIPQLNKSDDTLQDKNLDKEITMSAVNMECGEQLVNGNVRSAGRKSKKEGDKYKKSSITGPVRVGSCQRKTTKTSSISNTSQVDGAKSEREYEILIVKDRPNDASVGSSTRMQGRSSFNFSTEPIRMDIMAQKVEGDSVSGSTEGSSYIDFKHNQTADRGIQSGSLTAELETKSGATGSGMVPPVMARVEIDDVLGNDGDDCRNHEPSSELDAKPVFSGKQIKKVEPKGEINAVKDQESVDVYDIGATNSLGYVSYEWPSLAPVHLTSFNSHLPAATERLHLDVGLNWQNHFHQSFVQTVHQVRNPKIENACNATGIPSRSLPMSLDWPPMVRSISGMAASVSRNNDAGFISWRESSFQQGFAPQTVQCNTVASEDERKYSSDFLEFSDMTNAQDLPNEHDNHWISEEEFEVHAVSGMDYNQYFGGGVMYWNPSDHPGTGFSRPPSLSSDDSSWAWREADMNRAVDDMVAFSSSYSTNGLTSPSAASFCSPFDPLVPGHQALGYVIPGSEVNGKMLHSSPAMTDISAEENASRSLSSLPGDGEAKTGDSLPYPVLRPIIIPNMSQERSRSDFKRSHDHNNPCIPPNRRERPRIKRPPSPVVLCVPRAPPPPPPSPVGDSRKQRGFPTVRSGSSSPRHWGVRGWFQDGNNFEESRVRMDGSEVVWPPWRNKSLSALQLSQRLPGGLLQDHLIAISQLPRDQEHSDVAFPLQPPELLNCSTRKASLSLMHSLLHDEIDSFWKQVAGENLIRKPYINWAIKRVTRSLQVLWPRSRANIFGSNATGLSLPTSDVDLVVCLPPVRNLEPIKEAGILEGRNGIKETCLQHAARYLANQEWVKNDSLKIVENTAIPIIMLVIEVPRDFIASTASNTQTLKEEPSPVIDEQNNSCQTDIALDTSAWPECLKINNDDNKDVKSIRLDISFKSSTHTGLRTTELVKGLTEQFPATVPLALVLKQFLADRSLDQPYSGGLSSYCLVLLIIRFLQHEHHHGRPINQNFGSLLMDFLYFFGNVFDPRQMCVTIQGSGLYINRERGYSIDPIYIDDPLFPTNNVGRNCFRIHQCIKAFSEAYSTLENELDSLPDNGDSSSRPPCKILPKIIPSIGTS